ncbi:MAG: hypothetical protein ACK5NC_05235 [Vibrio sp.]
MAYKNNGLTVVEYKDGTGNKKSVAERTQEHYRKKTTTYEFKRPERKFNEGEWYPCTTLDGFHSIKCYLNGSFYTSLMKNKGGAFSSRKASDFSIIGESLGKIKFGDNDD